MLFRINLAFSSCHDLIIERNFSREQNLPPRVSLTYNAIEKVKNASASPDLNNRKAFFCA